MIKRDRKQNKRENMKHSSNNESENDNDWYDVTDRELDYGFDDREGK